jgi:hypothetical protein
MQVLLLRNGMVNNETFGEDDELPGDEVLAGFLVSVKRLFEE